MTDYEKLLDILDRARVEYDVGEYYNRQMIFPCKVIETYIGDKNVRFYFEADDSIKRAR